MKHKVTNQFTVKQEPNTVLVKQQLAQTLQQTTKGEWSSLFEEIRRCLLARILGLDKDGLVKLQGKIETISEIEQLIIEIASTPEPK